jgi:hypothetical protein
MLASLFCVKIVLNLPACLEWPLPDTWSLLCLPNQLVPGFTPLEF